MGWQEQTTLLLVLRSVLKFMRLPVACLMLLKWWVLLVRLWVGAFEQVDGLTLPEQIAATGGTADIPGMGPVAMGLPPADKMNLFLKSTFKLPSTPGGTDGSPALPFGTRHYLQFNKRSDGTVKTWFAGMAYYNLEGENSFIDAIRATDAEIEKSPIASRIFQYGPISTFWQVFDKLSDALQNMIVIFAVIIALVVFLAFELDLVAGVVTSLCCGLITIQVYGLATAFMNFNIFLATFVMIGMGMSVEFTCHLAAAVSTGEGTIEDRVSAAMVGCFPALGEGCMTTLLSILPLLFHPIPFFKKYFSVVMLIIIGVGALNGFVIMPSVLGLLGRIKDMRTAGLEKGKSCTKIEPEVPRLLSVTTPRPGAHETDFKPEKAQS